MASKPARTCSSSAARARLSLGVGMLRSCSHYWLVLRLLAFIRHASGARKRFSRRRKRAVQLPGCGTACCASGATLGQRADLAPGGGGAQAFYPALLQRQEPRQQPANQTMVSSTGRVSRYSRATAAAPASLASTMTVRPVSGWPLRHGPQRQQLDREQQRGRQHEQHQRRAGRGGRSRLPAGAAAAIASAGSSGARPVPTASLPATAAWPPDRPAAQTASVGIGVIVSWSGTLFLRHHDT
jgi:hypothetical protein